MDSVYSYFSSPALFTSSPIWMLGHKYSSDDPSLESSSSSTNNNNHNEFERFLLDWGNKLWFSYRVNFPYIEPTTYDSDVGWGCTLRSGQMLLAQAFITHFLGRFWTPPTPLSPKYPKKYYQIIKWFGDFPNDDFPYSIHNIAKVGKKLGKNIGEWFGPSTIALALEELVCKFHSATFNVVVSHDSCIYLDMINSKCADSQSTSWKPLLIFIPLRLGLDSINSLYIPNLLSTFEFPQSLGIVGGKPRSSLYFLAAQDNYLFYLDPHYPQPVIQFPVGIDPVSLNLDSFHCHTPKKILASEIDPSLALGFYCRDKADFDDFVIRAQHLTVNCETPLFSISSKSPEYSDWTADDDDKDVFEQPTQNEDEDEEKGNENDEISMDDLVIL